MPTLFLCEVCTRTGIQTLAAYRRTDEQDTLQGPALGDPDYWSSASPVDGLCADHYDALSPDARLDYVPIHFKAPEMV